MNAGNPLDSFHKITSLSHNSHNIIAHDCPRRKSVHFVIFIYLSLSHFISAIGISPEYCVFGVSTKMESKNVSGSDNKIRFLGR